MSFQNVLDADGIGVAITGMAIVFSGLVLISLYITSIPKLLGGLDKVTAKRRKKVALAKPVVKTPAGSSVEVSSEMMAAIAYVIRMEVEFEDAEDHQRITVQHDDSDRVWAVTGRLRTLSTRM